MSATIKRLNKAGDVPPIQQQWLDKKPSDVLTSVVLQVLDDVDSMSVDNFKSVVFRAARATTVCDYIELLDFACKHWGYEGWNVVLRMIDNPDLPESPEERRALLDQQHEHRARVAYTPTEVFPARPSITKSKAEPNEFGVIKGMNGKAFKITKSAEPKYFIARTEYFRNTNPDLKKQQDRAWAAVPDDIRLEFMAELSFFWKKSKVGQGVFIRFVTDLDKRYPQISSMTILDNAAVALGYGGWNSLRGKCIREEHVTAEIRRMHDHDRLMQIQEAKKGRKVFKAPVNHDQFVEFYFYQETDILVAIEDLLKVYADEHLDESMRRYKARNEPGAPEYRMGGEEVWLSFGIFIRAVRRLEVLKTLVVDDQSLKRLARMLYCWHFRRLLDGQIMITNCKRIPRRYRTLAYKNMYFNSLDQVQEDEGPDYSDIPFDDSQYEPEDPNDNFGNC